MLSIENELSKLNLSLKIIEKLNNKKIFKIKDVWILKRKELKELGFSDSEIKSIIMHIVRVKKCTEGLDLNKKIYD